MSNAALLNVYDGDAPSLAIAGGGGGGGVNSVNVGTGLVKTGTTNVNISLGFTAANQLLVGSGANAGAPLAPGAAGTFLRVNNAGTALEYAPVASGGVVSVTAANNNVGYVDNLHVATPHIGLAFPAGQGAIPVSTGNANEGAFTAGLTFPANQNWVLTADNMSATGCKWAAAAGTALVAELPLAEFVDGTQSKIGIDFAPLSVGQIPVGLSDPAGRVGTLTPALTAGDDGKVLTASSADAAAGGVKWQTLTGPGGAIQTNTPLKDTFSGGQNTISINFTDKVFGEIPFGNGTAETGSLLAPPTDSSAVGKVLTYIGANAGGIGWVSPASPAGGDTKVVHSSAASVNVPEPADTNTQLVIVGETINSGSWYGNAEYGTDLELWIEQIPSSGPPLFYMAKAVADGPTGRHVDLLNISLGSPEYIGTFSYVFDDGTGHDAWVNCYTYGRTTAGNIFEAAGGVFSGGVVIGGRFNRFLPSGATNPIILSNICLLTGTGASGGTIIALPCTTDPLIDSYPGVANTTASQDLTQEVCSITPYDANTNAILGAVPGFLITGRFDTLVKEKATTLSYELGYLNMAQYTLGAASAFSMVSLATTLSNGFGLGGSLPFASGGAVGNVRCCCFNLPAYSIIYFGGEGLTTALASGSPVGADTYALPANCEGFAVYDYTNSPAAPVVNNWGVNGIAACTPTFQTNGLYAIQPSSTLANEIIALGEQSFLVNKSNPISFVYTQLGVSGTTPICAGWPTTGLYGFFNSIVATDADFVGVGQIQADCCVFSTATTAGSKGEQYVCYFSAAGGTAPINIAPSPAGPLSPLVGGQQCRFGIFAEDPIQNPPPNTPIIGGTSAPGGFYLYVPVNNPAVEFVCPAGVVFRPPSGGTFTKAQFTTAYQSQSFISSSDRSSWIQIGAPNANIAYAN